jgi:glycerate 2-kinase
VTVQATPHNRAGELALEIYRRTLEECRGDRLVERHVRLEGDVLGIDGLDYDLRDHDRVIVAGAGKASVAMAQGIEEILGDRISEGLIVTKYGHNKPLSYCRIIESGHPVPDENSLLAGSAMLELATSVTERDLLVFLLSGGASALMEAPVEGVSLKDLQEVNEELLSSGATIYAINAIRARLSKIKGGGLAVAFAKSRNVVVYLSDVEGGLPAVVGSGPFISSSHSGEVSKALQSLPVEDRFPPHVVRLIRENAWMRNPGLQPAHVMIGNVQLLREKAGEIAKEMGLRCEFLPPLGGEAREYPTIVELPQATKHGVPLCQIGVGEPVVHKTGTGIGGRAQEMACAYAGPIAGRSDLAVLAAGSDGTDGPTDAAGALVDGETAARALAGGCSVEKSLAENDSYHFHAAAGTLIKTGPTGTNLNDILIVVRASS